MERIKDDEKRTKLKKVQNEFRWARKRQEKAKPNPHTESYPSVFLPALLNVHKKCNNFLQLQSLVLNYI